MKKTIVFLLAWAMLLSLAGCNLATEAEPMVQSEYSQDLPSEDMGIAITASVVSPGDTWNLHVVNGSEFEVAFQPEYEVELMEDGVYKNVPGQPLSVIIGNVSTLQPGDETDLEVSLSRYDCDMEEAGSYRVILPFTIRHQGQGEFDEYTTLAAPIVIE